MATVFRKTDKGQAEIETRAHRLTPRLRSALILVDGKRDSDELRKLIPQQADDALAALSAQGFIETASVTPAGAPPAAPAEPRAANASAAARDFDSLKRQLVRDFTDLTGPLGEAMALRMEKAPDRQALRTLLAAAGEYVIGVRGASAANDFVQRYADQLA